MKIQPISPNNSTFGYHTHIRDCWMAGLLPTVKKGLYGFPLKKKTCSNEHLLPASKGGTLHQGNVALADKYLNNLRGDKPLNQFVTKPMLDTYLEQFTDVLVKFKGKIFDGNKYKQDVLENSKKLDLKG